MSCSRVDTRVFKIHSNIMRLNEKLKIRNICAKELEFWLCNTQNKILVRIWDYRIGCCFIGSGEKWGCLFSGFEDVANRIWKTWGKLRVSLYFYIGWKYKRYKKKYISNLTNNYWKKFKTHLKLRENNSNSNEEQNKQPKLCKLLRILKSQLLLSLDSIRKINLLFEKYVH